LTKKIAVLLALTAAGLGATGSAQAAVFKVDTTSDGADSNHGDGACRTAAGRCTLRAAVTEAGSHPGSTVLVPAGRFVLTIPPAFELPVMGGDPILNDLDDDHGDITLLTKTTIHGAGARKTIVDGNHLDRVFGNLVDGTITDLTITGGEAKSHEVVLYGGGGGIGNLGKLTLERVTVANNEGGFGGGIFNIPGADLRIVDSTVRDNLAGEAGGIRFDWTGTMINTTVSGNRVVNFHDLTRPVGLAGKGGGIDARGPGVSILNSTITNNSTTDGGGGINISLAYNDVLPAELTSPLKDITAGQITLHNTIVAGNTSTRGAANCAATMAKFVSAGHNLSDDRSCSLGTRGDHAATAAGLRPLADNGGPTDTHALVTGSPAIGGADAAACPKSDQNGNARPAGSCDIGAVQYRLPAKCRKRRTVMVSLGIPKGAKVRRLRVTVDGHRARARKVGTRRAKVTLGKRTSGRYKLTIKTRSRLRGHTISRSRTVRVRACV
jgi:hypothetical protein